MADAFLSNGVTLAGRAGERGPGEALPRLPGQGQRLSLAWLRGILASRK